MFLPIDSILRLSSLNCHSMVMLLMVCHPLNFVSLLLLSGSLLSGHSIAQFDFTNRNCGSHVLTSYWSILLKELMVTRYNRIGLYQRRGFKPSENNQKRVTKRFVKERRKLNWHLMVTRNDVLRTWLTAEFLPTRYYVSLPLSELYFLALLSLVVLSMFGWLQTLTL